MVTINPQMSFHFRWRVVAILAGESTSGSFTEQQAPALAHDLLILPNGGGRLPTANLLPNQKGATQRCLNFNN